MSISLRRQARFLSFLLLVALLTVAPGCGGGAKPETQETVRKLGDVRLLVVDDAPLAAVIEREWKARAESKLSVTSITRAELADKTTLDADAVIYPAGLLGELAMRDLIQPLSSSAIKQPEYAVRDLLMIPRTEEGKWAGEDYAIPFGSPQLVVMYREDLFAAAKIKPPEDWETYQKIAQHFSDRKNWGELAPADDQPVYGAVEPLSEESGGQLLLARAACYARTPNRISTLFDYQTMQPQIASPPFVRALRETRKIAALHPDKPLRLGPHDVRKMFLRGNVAMAITWPTAAGEAVEDAAATKVNYAKLPGSRQFYSPSQEDWFDKQPPHRHHASLLGVAGRLGSVVKGAKDVRDAAACLMLLAGRQLSTDICPQSTSTTMFRGSHLAGAEKWVDAPLNASASRYADLVVELQEETLVLHSIRIPGRDEYLAALNQAVATSLAGEDETTALQKAAETWREITTRRGEKTQQQAYRQSLGLEE